jgi:hypothetical protein
MMTPLDVHIHCYFDSPASWTPSSRPRSGSHFSNYCHSFRDTLDLSFYDGMVALILLLRLVDLRQPFDLPSILTCLDASPAYPFRQHLRHWKTFPEYLLVWLGNHDIRTSQHRMTQARLMLAVSIIVIPLRLKYFDLLFIVLSHDCVLLA